MRLVLHFLFSVVIKKHCLCLMNVDRALPFNSCFSPYPTEKLAGGVQARATGSFCDYLGPPSGPSAFFPPTTPGEIESICQALDPSKGPGHDGFSPAVLRFASAELG